MDESIFTVGEKPPHKNMLLDFLEVLPEAPPVRVVSFREELPQRLVHYHHGDRERGCGLKMAPSPVRHCRRLLLKWIRLGRRDRQSLPWVGLDED